MKRLLHGYKLLSILLIPAIIAGSGCNKKSDDDVTIIPVVITDPVISNLTPTSATSGAYLTNFIANTITSYGVCWSPTNTTPTTNDSKVSYTVANAIQFEAQVTGLAPNTSYHLRGYCINNQGAITYGNVVDFKTLTATSSTYATVITYAGQATPGFVNGPLQSAQFSNPQAIAIDAQGNLYVADSFNNAIRKISGGVVTTLAGSGTPGYTDATGTDAQFYSPQGLTVDADGNVYVSDFGNNAIRKITPAGVVTTLAGGNGVGYADGSGSAVKFHNPMGLAVDAQGNIFVADKGNNVIRKITAAGVTTTFTGITKPGYVNATSTLSQFNNPTGVVLDKQGNLYVADLGNSAIRKVAADGSVTSVVGNPTATPELLNQPQSIAIDAKGNLFISDQTGRIMEIAGNVLYSIAGNTGTADYNDGVGTGAYFNSPQGLATDAQGSIYVADYNNNTIRKLVVITTP
jgi:sugar lactone lactonase YvrE